MVVDDEPRLISVVEAYLEQEGFEVATASNGREALFAARETKPDLIILDVMMPEMDGYEFMRLHRKEAETPIILLTAKVEEDDKVIGLELGADDYVTKPFRPRELVARVRAVLRRSGQTRPKALMLRAADIMLDRERPDDPEGYSLSNRNRAGYSVDPGGLIFDHRVPTGLQYEPTDRPVAQIAVSDESR